MNPQRNKIPGLVRGLLKWFKHAARDLPWRRDPHHCNPYSVYVSEIMLQQTQVRTVIPYWERWMREMPDFAAVAHARPARLHKLWEGLGYYRRVQNLQKTSRVLMEQNAGRMPDQLDQVLELPGIGRYTAGAICSIAYNQPAPILDGNVIRVLTRLFGILENPKERQTQTLLWQLAEALVKQAAKTDQPDARQCAALNQALMELGALVCLPRQPQCQACPVHQFCVARERNLTSSLPALPARAAAIRQNWMAFVLADRDQICLRQRPAMGINPGLWEFPNAQASESGRSPQEMAHLVLGFSPLQLEPLGSIQHSITRYRITLAAYLCLPPYPGKITSGKWKSWSQLRRLPLTAAHKKLARIARERMIVCG